MHNPRVTVLLPVYNGQRYLDESLASITAQEYRDFEIVIVDDGSTDETPRIIERWLARDERIVTIRQENGGISRACNAGLALARGEYLARQDADDISLPHRLAKQVAALDANADAVCVTLGRVWIDPSGKKIGEPPTLVRPPDVVQLLLHLTPTAVGVPGQAMMRTATMRAVGGWDPKFRVAQGWEFATRVAQHGRFLMLPEPGMLYRIHRKRVSEVHRAEQARNAIRVTQRWLTKLTGYEVPFDDAAASAGLWFLPPQRGGAATAARLLRDILARFGLSRSDEALVRRLARVRYARAAAYLARRAHVIEAAHYLTHIARV